MKTKLNYKELGKVFGGQFWRVVNKNGTAFCVVKGKNEKGEDTYKVFFTHRDFQNWRKLNSDDNDFINIINNTVHYNKKLT